MSSDERVKIRYRFTPNIDIPQTFTTLGIEYLDVSDTRVIAIYTRSIINIVISGSQLDNAQTLEIEVLDYPPKAGGDNAAELISMIVERISSAAGSDYQQIS